MLKMQIQQSDFHTAMNVHFVTFVVLISLLHNAGGNFDSDKNAPYNARTFVINNKEK